MDWYYSEDNQQRGPVSQEAMVQLIADGRIRPETLVWNETMSEWVPCSRAAVAEPAFAELIPQLNTTLGAVGTFEYAGFGIRLVAKILDGIILGIVEIVIVLVVFSIPLPIGPPSLKLFIIQFAIRVFYNTWFIGTYGATPGKMVCQLRVVTSDGGQVSYGRACGRFFAEILSAFFLCIGYIMAAFDQEKRTLHDRICDTRVIR